MKKQQIGIVKKVSSAKTISVEIVRRWKHPIYKKTVSKSKKYLVDNQKLELAVGDKVLIQETTPKSKRKSWEVVKKV